MYSRLPRDRAEGKALSWINLSYHEDHIPPHYRLTLDDLTWEGTFFGLTIGTRITVSQGAVNEVVIRRNSTPRQVLGSQTPSEVFTAHIMKGVRIDSWI